MHLSIRIILEIYFLLSPRSNSTRILFPSKLAKLRKGTRLSSWLFPLGERQTAYTDARYVPWRWTTERRVEMESKQVFDDGSPGDRVGSLRSPVNRGREKSVSKRRIGIGMSVCTNVGRFYFSLSLFTWIVGVCGRPLYTIVYFGWIGVEADATSSAFKESLCSVAGCSRWRQALTYWRG